MTKSIPDTSATIQIYRNEIILHVSVGGVLLHFDRASVIGRNGDVRLYENIPWVSRRHLEILPTKQGDVLIRDLNSLVGTYVNGHRISSDHWHKLVPSDKITLGPILSLDLVRTTVQLISQSEFKLCPPADSEKLAR